MITGGLVGDRFNPEQTLEHGVKEATETLGELAHHAKDMGINLTLEPLHPMVCGNRSVISTLNDASAMLDAINMDPIIGITLDTYALWWQTDLLDQISAWANRISHLHVSDWLTNTTDLRLDRGMPGDGLINNRGIRDHLERCGFTGPVEVEIFSKNNWWQRPGDEVIRTILSRYQSAL